MSEVESRPAWWRVAIGAWGGFMAGGLVGGWLVDGSFYITDKLTGRQGGPEGFESITWHDFGLMYLLWVIIFGFMQFLSARMSRWTKTVWVTAALQTLVMIALVAVGGIGFLPGIVFPWVIAYALLRTAWLPGLISRDRARYAARFPGASH